MLIGEPRVITFLFSVLASPYLGNLAARADAAQTSGLKVSNFLYEYSESKRIYMKANYVNADHTHEHHRRKSFAEELEAFVRAYGLEWKNED